MMLFERKELASLVLSIGVISTAFTFQKLSLIFFLKCFFIVGSSYFLHEVLHAAISRREGIHSKCRIWPLGVILTVLSGLVSKGAAVLALPTVIKIKEIETARWSREKVEFSAREVGLASVSGPLSNLILATAFLALFETFWLPILRLGILINLWIALANLIPTPPIDGAKIMSWDRRVWLLLVFAGLSGILGLLV